MDYNLKTRSIAVGIICGTLGEAAQAPSPGLHARLPATDTTTHSTAIVTLLFA